MFDAAAAATAAEVNQEQVAQEQAEAAVSSDAGGDGPTADQRESQDLLQAIATYHPGESTTEIAFVDPTVPNYQEMIAEIGSNVDVVVLDATRDGMGQIAESLAGRSDIDAIHLISHGSAGELQLGTGTLTAESMSGKYANEMATIRESLSDQADLLVYGCNFGEGSEGVDAVNLLAEITGADVAASSDRTGHIDLGGDWEFEVQVGSIETDLALTDATQMNWAGVLGTETVRDEFSARSYGNNDGTQRWASNWSETDADGGGAKGGDIRVKSGQLRIDTDAVGNAAGRSVDLSGATSATLTFTYSNTLSGADRIEARASNDGEATYRTLAGGVFSNSSNTGTGSLSLDISEYASSNTRIQFIVMTVERGGGDRLSVDNVQVSYNTGATNSAPTISSQGGGTTASVTVAENHTAVTATDVDAGQSLTYSIAGGADAAQFTIDGNTGELRFASVPNYEVPTDSGGNNVYDVTVQVSDKNGGTDTQAMAVTVANTNETPTDLALSANTVTEHAANGTVVGTVSGTDPDGGDSKTYSLTDTAGGRFAINSATGELTVADGTLLNYEAVPSHSVTVRVTDRGGLTYDETFTINLTNVNEAPTITSNGGGATASLNVAENQTTVTTMAAVDVDTGTTLTYSIAGGPDAARFSIDGATGALRFSAAPNFERPSDVGRNNVYDVTVQVSDGQGGTTTQSISVRVTDVNEAPRITSNRGGDVASVTIRENGSAVTTVRATDPDRGAGITYSVVGGADAAFFTINPSTGVLRFSSAPNFEQPIDTDRNNVYQVVVQASDGRGGVDSQSISVRVTNVNEAPTGADATITITEDTAQTLSLANFGFGDVDAGDSLSAVRIDTIPGTGSLTLSGVAVTVGQVISVADITAGNLVFTPAADANGTGYTSFTFSVRDSNNAYDTVPNTLTVNVTAANDAPVISSIAGDTLTYTEGAGEVTIEQGFDSWIQDVDSASFDTGTLTVSIPSGGDSAEDVLSIRNQGTAGGQIGVSGSNVTFQGITIGTFTGGTSGLPLVVTLNSNATPVALDALVLNITYENTDTNAPTTGARTVRFTLTDGDGGTSANYDTTVTVSGANDAPTDLALSANTVVENAANRTVVGTVSGTDPDSGDTKAYSFTDSAGGRFEINSSTGQITVANGSLLNYEATTSHNVTVRVTDSGGLTYDETFTINLTNVNEAPTGEDATVTINEDTAHTFTTENFGFGDVDAGDSLSTVRIDTLPSTGSLTLSGVAVTAGQVITVADITAGDLVFTPAANTNGTGYATFTFSVRDSNNAYDATPNTLTFTVTAVNDAPTGLPLITGTVSEDQTLTADTSGIADADGLSTLSYQWLRNGMAIAEATSSTYTLGDADVGTQISVTVSYTDGQGTSESVTSVPTEAVTNVNDARLLVTNTGSTVAEGSIDTIDASELVVTDVDNGVAQLTYTIGTGPAYGRLELTTAPGASAATFTQADIAANRLVYVHNGSETTSDSFTFTVGDGAGGALGTTTMTLTITPVNDAPTITSDGGTSTASINVAENVSAITIVTGADVDLPAQALTYSISGGVDQARFTLNTVTGSLNFAAPANFEAATDANGDNVYVVQVQVTDSQGANTIQTIHVTVTDVVEHAPSTPPTIPPVLLPQPPVPPGPGTPPTAGPPTSDHGLVPGLGPSGPPVELHPISQEPLTLVLPPDRLVARVPEEPRKPTDDVKETPLFTVLPVEPTATLEPEPPETKQSASDLLMAKLDEMTVSLEQAMSVSQEQREIVARVAAVTGITLSAGFITWALRSGTLLASCLATMPAWRHFDPLPVVRLSRAERTRRREEMARAGQQEATEFSGLKRILDDKPPLKRTA